MWWVSMRFRYDGRTIEEGVELSLLRRGLYFCFFVRGLHLKKKKAIVFHMETTRHLQIHAGIRYRCFSSTCSFSLVKHDEVRRSISEARWGSRQLTQLQQMNKGNLHSKNKNKRDFNGSSWTAMSFSRGAESPANTARFGDPSRRFVI